MKAQFNLSWMTSLKQVEHADKPGTKLEPKLVIWEFCQHLRSSLSISFNAFVSSRFDNNPMHPFRCFQYTIAIQFVRCETFVVKKKLELFDFLFGNENRHWISLKGLLSEE